MIDLECDISGPPSHAVSNVTVRLDFSYDFLVIFNSNERNGSESFHMHV